jgi:hypothetical protein
MSWGHEAIIKELRAENARLIKFVRFVSVYGNTPLSLRKGADAILQEVDNASRLRRLQG